MRGGEGGEGERMQCSGASRASASVFALRCVACSPPDALHLAVTRTAKVSTPHLQQAPAAALPVQSASMPSPRS
ncbi:hypothetical protein KC19_6G190100 [Ceratodon purpureus]|uniref:Uncharacterized protein n=1 Tax=Ceratodon purpureus TaxID=3225 RepID=A0A8T0HJ58_CERPU|nr:hypothetical protein KC19_6G190100 [Ceratodon purpureus]